MSFLNLILPAVFVAEIIRLRQLTTLHQLAYFGIGRGRKGLKSLRVDIAIIDTPHLMISSA